MQPIPQTVALSQISKDAPAVGEMLKDGPVLLMNRSTSFGMLVGVEEWNKTSEYIRQLERIHADELRRRQSETALSWTDAKTQLIQDGLIDG